MAEKFGVVEKRFNYKGHECLVVFTCLGVRNGYVSYDKVVDYMSLDIDCHGGLTFGDELPNYYEPTKAFYIGFDCNHCWDGHDYEQAFEYELISQEQLDDYRDTDDCLFDIVNEVRTKEYVENECKKIVDQIVEEK